MPLYRFVDIYIYCLHIFIGLAVISDIFYLPSSRQQYDVGEENENSVELGELCPDSGFVKIPPLARLSPRHFYCVARVQKISGTLLATNSAANIQD